MGDAASEAADRAEWERRIAGAKAAAEAARKAAEKKET